MIIRMLRTPEFWIITLVLLIVVLVILFLNLDVIYRWYVDTFVALPPGW